MKKLLLLIILVNSIAFSQNLDSLYNVFLSVRGNRAGVKMDRVQAVYTGGKCGLGIITSVQENYNNFTPERRRVIDRLLFRPALQTSIVTSNNKFRIHYDTTGVNKPGYSITEFAAVLDSVYNFEVNILGYPPAPDDGTEGGDGLYDFYIENLPNGLYGSTTPDLSLGNDKSTAYTELDNDFAKNENYNSFNINGAKVTAAHEYHHAIQIGNYINRYSLDGFYYEITSTAMEEFAFDDVNDYYAYMRNYFNHPELSLSKFTGYDLAILNIFFAKEFDQNFLKRIWELMPDNRALTSVALATAERGSTIGHELNQFGLWTYFTGYRAVPNFNDFFDYDEAVNYPLILPTTTIEFIPPKKSVNFNSSPLSNIFLLFPDYSNGNTDTLVTILTNSDVANAVNSPNSTLSLHYELTSSFQTGSNNIGNKYYSLLTSSNADMFVESNIFNNVPVNGNLEGVEIDYAYPQPFYYGKNSAIFIPAEKGASGSAEIKIFSAAMDLVYSASKIIYSIDKVVVRWDGMDNRGNKLPSGIYIFVVKSGDNIKKGKLVILNE